MTNLNFSWIIDGKLAGHQGPSSVQDLVWLKKQGMLALVRMAEEHKAQVTGSQVEQVGLWDCHEPVPDFTAPNPGQVNKMVNFITKSLSEGRPVGVSCGAGIGRTGTILACYLVSQGYEAGAAMDEVRAKRPGSIERKSQEEAVKAYAKVEKQIPGMPAIARDQPRLEWMNKVGNRVVAKVSPPFPNEIPPDWKDIYAFDFTTQRLQPVVLPKYGELLDFSLRDRQIFALCRDRDRLSLMTLDNTGWQSESLPEGISETGAHRIVANDNLVICFTQGGAYVRTGKTWQSFVKLFSGRVRGDVPQHILSTEEGIYAGYNVGEWGGVLVCLDKSSGIWRDCSKEGSSYMSVTGIAQSSDHHVWLSTGLAHLSGGWGSIHEYDGNFWKKIIPASETLPDELPRNETVIRGISFMPSGELYILADKLGLLKLDGNVMSPAFNLNWHEIVDSIYLQELAIDRDGRIFIGTHNAGVIVLQRVNGELTIRRLTFDAAAPAVHLEEFLSQL
ncbi:MAG: dual specificity protein phosphatase family protein [Dehalococcoidia bacterium]|nr:dual specificity protein phosphatase family protein [Dehalococcoidia bacterium]